MVQGFGRARCICIASLVTSLVSACVTVKPYEREVLARPDMQLDANPQASEAQVHSTDVREGSVGGFGIGGGGCGCN